MVSQKLKNLINCLLNILGWGQTEKEFLSDVLLHITVTLDKLLTLLTFQVPIVGLAECLNTSLGGLVSSSTDSVLCAGGEGNSTAKVTFVLVTSFLMHQ